MVCRDKVLLHLIQGAAQGVGEVVVLRIDCSVLKSHVEFIESHGSRVGTQCIPDRHPALHLSGADLQPLQVLHAGDGFVGGKIHAVGAGAEHQAHQSAVFVCLIVQVAEFAVCKGALNFFAIVS